jgi:hypothetical protein
MAFCAVIKLKVYGVRFVIMFVLFLVLELDCGMLTFFSKDLFGGIGNLSKIGGKSLGMYPI